MYCKNLKWQPGQRTFGSNIPAYAQGAYFPGDEPGYICKISGEPCAEDDEPQWCAIQNDTGWFCPERMADEGREVMLTRNYHGVISCENGNVYGQCRVAPTMEE